MGWKSAFLAGVACFACAVIVGSWYEGHRSADTQYPPGSHASTWFLWSAGNAIVFAFAITRLKGVEITTKLPSYRFAWLLKPLKKKP